MKKTIGLIVVLVLFTLLADGAFGAYPQRRFGIRQDAVLPVNNQMENKNAIYSYVFELGVANNSRYQTITTTSPPSLFGLGPKALPTARSQIDLRCSRSL